MLTMNIDDDGSCVDEDDDGHTYENTNGASLRLSLFMCYGLLDLLAALFVTSCLIILASHLLDLLSKVAAQEFVIFQCEQACQGIVRVHRAPWELARKYRDMSVTADEFQYVLLVMPFDASRTAQHNNHF